MDDDPSNEVMEHLGEVMLKRLRSASRAVREVLHAEHVQTPINATLDQVASRPPVEPVEPSTSHKRGLSEVEGEPAEEHELVRVPISPRPAYVVPVAPAPELGSPAGLVRLNGLVHEACRINLFTRTVPDLADCRIPPKPPK